MKQLRITSIIAWILISFSINVSSARAQNANTSSTNSERGSDLIQRDGRRTAGGDRGTCPAMKNVNDALTAFVAEKGNSLTLSDSPTLLFYAPYVSNSPINAKFSLQNDDGYNVIKPPIMLKLSGTPGIIKIPVPKSLEKGKYYRWSLAITCDSEDQSKNPGVHGWVKQVESSPNLISQLQKRLSKRELATVYRKEGLLLDALALLVEIRNQDIQAKNDWNSLLKSLDLEVYAENKVVEYYTQLVSK